MSIFDQPEIGIRDEYINFGDGWPTLFVRGCALIQERPFTCVTSHRRHTRSCETLVLKVSLKKKNISCREAGVRSVPYYETSF